jgi:hypothetical protein
MGVIREKLLTQNIKRTYYRRILSGLSSSAALIFASDREVRFVPAADYFGTPGTLTVRLADGSTALTSSTTALDTKNLSTNGGTGTTGRP